MGLICILDRGEKVIADGGYKGEDKIWSKGNKPISGRDKGAIRARHEKVNSRLKKVLPLVIDFVTI